VSMHAYLQSDSPRQRTERIHRAETHNHGTHTTETWATLVPRHDRRRQSGPEITVAGGRWFDLIKNTSDFVIAATILLLSLPVLVIAYLAIRLTSRGPAFYSQLRLGHDGKPYVIYKLRSMYHDCERKSGIQWSTRGDPRVTPVGRILRKTHLDEIPQLWNVLRGEMSLIGPRPERPELVVKLEQDLPYYRDRLLVKPGLTGLAQIQLPPDTDLESVRQKLFLDRVYVSRRSLWLDCRIYLATAFYLLGVSFPTLCRWFSLPHELHVNEEPQEEVLLHRRPTPLYTTVSIHN
jgi:lipopolysaccharide/colanic/teichoic acid biosynthesis glycosyltransferase